MSYSDFINFKDTKALSQYKRVLEQDTQEELEEAETCNVSKRAVDARKETRVYWSKLMQIKFVQSDKDKMFFKYNYSDLEWKVANMVDFPTARTTRVNNVERSFQIENLPHLYNVAPGINVDKQASLLRLCEDGKINMRFHDFYRRLPLSPSDE